MRRIILALAMGWLAGGFASAARDPVRLVASKTAPPTETAIRSLVEQLGSEDFAEREAASAAIARVGAPAIPSLEAALENESPEIRSRAGILLVQIRRTAESAARLAAKRVKLDFKDMPLGTAINELKARTGLNVALDSTRVANPLRRMTCQTGELPVWEALEAFESAAGLREVFQNELEVPKGTVQRRGYVPLPPAPNADAVAITLIDGKPDRLPGSRSSAVRIQALPARFPGHKVTLGTGEVALCLDVTPVPGLGWQEVTAVRITRLIDSNGFSGSMGAEKETQPGNDPSGVVVFAARGGMAMRFDVNGNPLTPESQANPRVLTLPLKLRSDAPRSIRRLEGSIFAELQLPDQQLVALTEPAKNTGTWINGPGELRVSVLEVKEAVKDGAAGSVKVQLQFPSAWLMNLRMRGWNPGWPQAPRMTQGYRVEARDPAGKPFPLTSNGFAEMSDDGMTMIQTVAMSFRHGAGVPAKIVVIGPKQVTVEVPFALENVPLP